MLFVIIALVIAIAIALAFVIRAVVASARRKEKAKREVAKLEWVRAARAYRAHCEIVNSIHSTPALDSLVDLWWSSWNRKVHKHTKSKHIKRKHYGIAYTYVDKYELPCLVGAKRLVDRDAETNSITSLYEISDNESHYQCRKYKFDRREARRNKRAMRESFVSEW